MLFSRRPGGSKRGSTVTRLPHKRLVVPATIVVFVLITVLVASAAAPPNIDMFATGQTTLTATSGSPAGGIAADGGGGTGGILGRQREAYAQVNTGDPNPVSVIFNGTTMSISTGDNTTSTTTLTYDGTANVDPDPANVGTTGLNGVESWCAGGCDLTQGGNTNGFRFGVLSDDTFGDLTVTVWNGAIAGAYCTRTFTNFFPGGFATGPARDFLVEFPSILNGTCSGTVTGLFSHVGAVQFQIKGAALDMSIDTIDISVFDWGDLPETPGTSPCLSSTYATTELCEGPRHVILGNLYLGPDVDPSSTLNGELDGQPSQYANGDDLNVQDDENGVTVQQALSPGGCPIWGNGSNGGRLQITGTGEGRLVGWIDFNNDGFQAGDTVINRIVTGSWSPIPLDFTIPSGTFNPSCEAHLYARFRLFPPDAESTLNATRAAYAFDGRDQFNQFGSPLTPPGRASKGEVEDYRWDFSPTAVQFASLNATAQPSAIEVAWETVSELDNLGFNVYRDTTPDGPGVKLNSRLIPAPAPGSPNPQSYRYRDSAGLVAGQTYYYWLEDVSLGGGTTRHGPVSVTYNGPNAVTLASLAASAAPRLWAPALGLLMLLGLSGLLMRRRALRG